jgi:hypothetical protein
MRVAIYARVSTTHNTALVASWGLPRAAERMGSKPTQVGNRWQRGAELRASRGSVI